MSNQPHDTENKNLREREEALARQRAEAIRRQAEEDAMAPRAVPTQRGDGAKPAPKNATPTPKKKPAKPKKYRTNEQKARMGCLIAFLVLILVVAGAIFGGYLYVQSEIGGGGNGLTEPIVIDVPAGAGGNTVSQLLDEEGIVGNATIFRLYVRFKDAASDFISGQHQIEPGMGYDEIIAVISTPPLARPTADIRFIEGRSVMSIASEFEQANLCTAEEFLAAADNLENYSDIPFIARIIEEQDPTVFHRSEGYLFPNTYSFFTDDTVEDMVRRIYEEMDSKFTQEMYDRMDELEISLKDTITLASLIQAEAGHVDQQAAVSGVFWNRLGPDWSRGTMGSDVTLRYVKIWMQWNMPEYADKTYRQISYDEAREAVGSELFYAYVTDDSDPEARTGLPTGPICGVSETAIQAALYPEAHDYFYFLTDFYENYYYARTYNEHEANVATMNEQNARYEQEQAEAAAASSSTLPEGETSEGSEEDTAA